MGLELFIKSIEKVCGPDREKGFVVTLKRESLNEAMRRMLSRAQVVSKLPGLVKLKLDSVEVSVSATGTLLVKNVEGEDEVRRVLSSLLEQR
ncbi:MAG: hypothetical protein N3H31_04615 [Candidatus Nezhaarchaeota archaeon]|nr:hypothetical protein [Candidatus Nezhaarchaeota archaeon]